MNRAPIAGKITAVDYTKGKFLVASREDASSAERAEYCSPSRGDGTTVMFSQIAGLIARRIVCYKKPGDQVAKGERVG